MPQSISASSQALRASIEGTWIAYSLFGQTGPWVLLVHGIPGDRHCWESVARELATNHRVVVPDLAGFGDSGDAPLDAHAAEHAHVLSAFLSALGIHTLHLVGFDFGGPVCVVLADLLRHNVQSLTIANTNVFPDTPIPLPLRVARWRRTGAFAYRVFFGRFGLFGMWLAATRQRRAFSINHYRRLMGSRNTVRTTREIFLRSMRDLPGLYRPIRDALQRIELPILVVWSDRDPFCGIGVGKRTAALSPHSRLELLDDTGHFTPYERPREFARAVARHVESSLLRTDPSTHGRTE